MEWQGILLIVAAALVFAATLTVVILLIGRFALRRVQAGGRERLEQLGFRGERQTDAVSLGVTSLGKTQVRGNGVLGLDEDQLLFLQAVPSREVRIPLERITAVDTPRSHLGKSYGRRLLRVTWTGEGGEADSIAWWVADLEGWLAALETARA